MNIFIKSELQRKIEFKTNSKFEKISKDSGGLRSRPREKVTILI